MVIRSIAIAILGSLVLSDFSVDNSISLCVVDAKRLGQHTARRLWYPPRPPPPGPPRHDGGGWIWVTGDEDTSDTSEDEEEETTVETYEEEEEEEEEGKKCIALLFNLDMVGYIYTYF